MSYFTRLVVQSRLDVAGRSGNVMPTFAGDPGAAPDLAASGTGDVVDVLQVEEVVEARAPAASDVGAPPLVRGHAPVTAAKAQPDVVEVSTGAGAPRRAQPPSESPPTEALVETLRVPPVTAEPAASAASPTPAGDGSPYERALQRVLRWVASAPPAASAAGAVSRPSAALEAAVHADAMPPDQARMDAARQSASSAAADAPSLPVRVAPPRPAARDVAAATRVAEAARDDAPHSRPDAGPPVVEETVHVSIGAISVRVEAPAPPVVARPARTAGPTPSPTAAPERAGSRLARRYLHP